MILDENYPESQPQWVEVGFNSGHVWQTERTELDGPIEEGVRESIQALEDSKRKANYSIP